MIVDKRIILPKRREIMKVNRIEVQGFKNIEKINLEFNILNALVSLNNYGKSNVLDAIDFGIEFIKRDSSVKSNMMEFLPSIPVNRNMNNSNYTFLTEIEINVNDVNYLVEYSYCFKWESDESEDSTKKILDEKLRFKKNSKGQKYNTYFSRAERKATYQSAKTGRNDKKILIDDNSLIINKLMAYDDLFYLDIVKAINNINFYINRSFDATNSFEVNPLQRKEKSVLDISSAENIPRVIYTIKKKYPDKYELIKNTFIDLFPNIKDIAVEEILKGNEIVGDIPENAPFKISNEIYLIFVKDKNIETALQFTNLSTGAKRIFLFLTYIVLAEINNVQIIAIEELENSIHPGLFYRFINILSQLASDNLKIILSSHSPYIIQYMELDDIFVGIPNANGLAKFSKIKKSSKRKITKLADMYGMSTGDYLFEQMNGSIDDIEELNSFLEE